MAEQIRVCKCCDQRMPMRQPRRRGRRVYECSHAGCGWRGELLGAYEAHLRVWHP